MDNFSAMNKSCPLLRPEQSLRYNRIGWYTWPDCIRGPACTRAVEQFHQNGGEDDEKK